MPRLEVLENKKLVLKNVLHKELKGISMDTIDKEIYEFGKMLDLLKVQTFGPLIIKTAGTNITEDGNITVDYDLFIQAHDYKQYKNSFLVEDRHVCEHCAYVHYEGSPEDLNYAHMKLDLFFYEHDLKNQGILYSVCIQEGEEYIVMDLFRPVEQL